MTPTHFLIMVFQFKHNVSLKYKEENGFYMRFSFDLLDLDEKKRELLSKDYVRDWILKELEANLQKVAKKLESNPPTKSEFGDYKFHQFKNGNEKNKQ